MPASADVPAPCLKIFCPTCGGFMLEAERLGEARVRCFCSRCAMDIVVSQYHEQTEGKIKPRMMINLPIPAAA